MLTNPECVYVISGNAGAWSDYRTWPVRAFLDQREAERYLSELEIEARMTAAAYADKPEYERRKEKRLVLDPYMDHSTLVRDDPGYFIMEVPLGMKFLGVDAQALLAAAKAESPDDAEDDLLREDSY